jgi:diguanylate cyclase (GGDEF)-like protein
MVSEEEGNSMRDQLKSSLHRLVEGNIQRLAALTSAGITVAGLMLLAIIAYAGTAANKSASERERTLLQNALNRGIARALNEQKSVAWWDDAVTKISAESLDEDFVNSNFGVFLTETYGHDEVYILNAANQPLYAFANGARAVPATYEKHRGILTSVVGEARGDHHARLKSRPDAFGQDQKNYRTLSGALEIAHWAGHILSVDGRLSIVAAITIVPNQDTSLLKGTPNLLVSVTYIDDDYIAALGRSLLLDNLSISPKPNLRNGTVSEPFVGDDGTHAGFLSWTTQRPGRVLLNTILPLVAFGVIAVALLAMAMLRRLKASSHELASREVQSRHDARHDALSGLPNRSHFAGRLQVALNQLAAQKDAQVLVAYVDVDRFKDVNDTLGHHAGDELIKAVASRLTLLMRSDNLLARYGGDEFAILWIANGPNAAKSLAERIKDVFASRFDVDGQSLRVTASAGIAISDHRGSSADDLMRQADIALYEAKAQGRDRAVFFSDDMAQRVEERLSIENQLRIALETGQLRLNYQPIISCETGKISGVEALLRWRHPERGEVPPGVFVPIAEQSGLMPALGEWVLCRAMEESRLWPNLLVSVNLSPVQFRQVNLEALLQRLVSEYHVDPRQFVLEITEGVLMESSNRTSHTLDAVHAMGFKTALDDFGTGYSSLAYLCNFRFDKIKIDRAFVSGMSKSESYAKIVNAVISLGKGLGMEIVAEGVETAAEVNVMTMLGCTELQGYFFSKPIEVEDMSKLLVSFKPQPRSSNQSDQLERLPRAKAR